MTASDLALERWRAAARAAGVRLSDADVRANLGRGALDTVVAFEAWLRDFDARLSVPDYLDDRTREEPGNG